MAIKLSKMKKIKRNFKNIPLIAYKPKDWCNYIANLYPRFYDHDYSYNPKLFALHSTVLTKHIYPIVFNKFRWSAEDFANFIQDNLATASSNGYYYEVPLLKSEFNKKEMDKFDIKLQEKRARDRFEQAIYLPHNPLTDELNDLWENIDEINGNLRKIYHYGIPLFQKYYQIKNNLDFKESCKQVREIIKKEIVSTYKTEKSVLERFFSGIAKNSILWSPYIESKMLKKNISEKEILFDWRLEFKKAWEYYRFQDEYFWETHEGERLKEMLPHVKHIFMIDLNRILGKV